MSRQKSNSSGDSASKWSKTQYAYLQRYVPSGTYYARFKVRGKIIQRSLKTDKISVAEQRLGNLVKEERKKAAAVEAHTRGRMTVGQAIEIYLERDSQNPSLKTRTKEYRKERLEGIKASWPELQLRDAAKVSANDCRTWAARYTKKVSASTYNHAVEILRAVFAIAVESGARYDNPALAAKRVRVTHKKPALPEMDQFEPFVQAIKRIGNGFAKPAANLVRFLAFGGFRKGEAAHITWADVDFRRGQISIHGDPWTGTKTVSSQRVVPMIPEMRRLLERVRDERPYRGPNDPSMEVRECQKSMDRAAKPAVLCWWNPLTCVARGSRIVVAGPADDGLVWVDGARCRTFLTLRVAMHRGLKTA